MLNLNQLLKTTISSGTRIYIFFVKIMIPTLIFVKILAEVGAISYLAKLLTPLIIFLGVGGEAALVSASAWLVNLYASLSVFSNMQTLQSISIAQATTISFLILITHNLFMEMAVVRIVGLRLPIIFIFRLSSTIFIAYTFITLANYLGWYQDTANIIIEPQPLNSSFTVWVVNLLKSLFLLFFVVYIMVFIVELLKQLRFTDLLEFILSPILKLIGINKNASNITVIGLLLGLAYGGAFFAEEIKKGTIKHRDIYLSMAFMCLCHAIIEDTLLMVVIGGDFIVLIVFRLIMSLLLIWLLSLIINNCSDRVFYKYFYHKK